MHYDPSIEREERELAQLSDWLRTNGFGTPKPTMTVSEVGAMMRDFPHSRSLEFVAAQIWNLQNDEEEDMRVIHSDLPEFDRILVVKDKENSNG